VNTLSLLGATYTNEWKRGVMMDEFKTFSALSHALTGISPLATIVPKSLTETIAKDYLHRLKEQFGGDLVALLTLYDSKSGMPDPLAALLADPSFTFPIESMAKQVVNVWLLSQYRVETGSQKGDAAPAFDVGYFEKGYIWPAIKAHPIGFSHSGHGYWRTKP
jgi:hypothetical protein